MSEQVNTVKPFSCSYSAQFPELLKRLGCSIAISTYQAGKVIFISPKDEESLIQLPRTFDKPMGIGLNLERGKMAVATRDEVTTFVNSPSLATYYPSNPHTYDALFMPRAKYFTGPVDLHDLEWINGELYGINTLFSCLVKIDENYSFIPVWKPPFISEIASEDRCHLNGLALKNGRPKYVTTFGTGNEPQSWRNTVTETGTIIDLETDEIVVDHLPMPHSPCIIDGALYLLLSATGELAKVDVERGSYEVITNLNGFVRGMSYHNELLFIGMSKLRKNSSTFAQLDIANRSDKAGVKIVHLPTGSYMGEIAYQTSVDEIYDIKVLPDMMRPNILNSYNEKYKMGLSTPEKTFWGKPTESRKTLNYSSTKHSSS